MNLTSVGFAYGRFDLWVCCFILFYFYTEGWAALDYFGIYSFFTTSLFKQRNKQHPQNLKPTYLSSLDQYLEFCYSLVILVSSESIAVYRFLECHHHHFNWIWMNSDAKFCQKVLFFPSVVLMNIHDRVIS